MIPKDIYLGHRVCQAYELIQFIESTSSADTTHLTILLGDLNLRSEDLGFKLIKSILQLNDSFLQRIKKVKMMKNRKRNYSGFFFVLFRMFTIQLLGIVDEHVIYLIIHTFIHIHIKVKVIVLIIYSIDHEMVCSNKIDFI